MGEYPCTAPHKNKLVQNPLQRFWTGYVVARRGFEPLIPWLRTTYPRPLDERAAMLINYYNKALYVCKDQHAARGEFGQLRVILPLHKDKVRSSRSDLFSGLLDYFFFVVVCCCCAARILALYASFFLFRILLSSLALIRNLIPP